MDTPFKPTYECESKTWTLGQKLIFQLVGLPPNQKLDHADLILEGSVTNNDPDDIITVYTQQLCQLFAQIYHKSIACDIRTTGRALWVMYRSMFGKALGNAGQAIPVADSDGDETIPFILTLPIYFSDRNAKNPFYACQPTELLEGKTIEVQCASTNVIGTSDPTDGDENQTFSAGTVRLVLYFVPGDKKPNSVELPSKLRLDFEDWNQQTAFLKVGGAYSHLMIYDETDDALDQTDYTRVRVQLDGYDVVDRLPTDALIGQYNDAVALGGTQAAGNTSSVSETEQLANVGVTGFLPILNPPQGYLLEQLPKTQSGGAARVDIEGDSTGARFLYRMIDDMSQSEREEIAKMLGISNPKTASYASKHEDSVPPSGSPQHVASLQKKLPVVVVGGVKA